MPVVPKQDLIKAYGHFFVVGLRYHSGDILAPDDNIAQYGQPDPATQQFHQIKSVDVMEFFGKAHHDDLGKDKNMFRRTFQTIEGAEQEAQKIANIITAGQHPQKMSDLLHRAKDQVVELAAAGGFTFDSSEWNVPVNLLVEPDMVQFPDVIAKGSKVYGYSRDSGAYGLNVFEADVKSVRLTTFQEATLPFQPGYKLNVDFAIVADQPAKISKTLRVVGQGDQWDQTPTRGSLPGPDVRLITNKDVARVESSRYAATVYGGVEQFMAPRREYLPGNPTVSPS